MKTLAHDGSTLLRTALEGHAANASGDYENALLRFDQVLLLTDTLPDVLLGRALALGRSGRFEEAIADLTRLEKQQGANAHLLKLRGLAWLELAKYQEAATDFEKALAVKPADTELLYLAALTNYKSDALNQALVKINQAIGSDSLNAQYFY